MTTARTRARAALALFTLVGFSAGAHLAAQPQCTPLPKGPTQETDVDGGTDTPDVAVFGDGSGMGVFSTFDSDGDDRGIYMQRISASGGPVGGVLQINSFTQGRQEFPRIAANPGGRFVVVWKSETSPGDTDGSSVRGRVFRADGSPVGNDFQVNVSTSGNQRQAVVGMANDGSFVAAWYDDDGSGRGREIRMRRFAADGSPLSGEVQVNTIQDSAQYDPDIAVAPDGRFVIVWGDAETDTVRARRYAANGQPLDATEIQVNTVGGDAAPEVGIDASGAFMVTWHSRTSTGNDNSFTSVQARGFGWNGIATSPQKQMNQRIDDDQFDADVVGVGGGAFFVVWKSQSRDPVASRDQPSAGRGITSQGEFQGPEITIEASTFPRVGSNRQGDSIVIMFKTGGVFAARSYQHPCAQGGTSPTGCVEGPTTLCLTQDRFQVTAVWQTNQAAGDGRAVELTSDTGYFWFFDAANVEVVLKVLDACQFAGNFWVFAGGLTDVEVELTIVDTQTGAQRVYVNPRGVAFEPVQDTGAFSTCP